VHVEFLVEVGVAADESSQLVELRGRRLVLLGDDERSDALGCVVEQKRAGGVERLELRDPVAELLERPRPLVETPEENPDDHSSGGVQGS